MHGTCGFSQRMALCPEGVAPLVNGLQRSPRTGNGSGSGFGSFHISNCLLARTTVAPAMLQMEALATAAINK